MGKRQIPSENLPTSILDPKETSEYFTFLKEADEEFKDSYKAFPDTFRAFSQNQDFNRLKTILTEKFLPNGVYERKITYLKQRYVIRMLNLLKDMIGAPRKISCMNERGEHMNWHEAFDSFINITSSQCSKNKLQVKDKLKELWM
ncbi:hypothetical protein SteCoe_16958 [Stentor coeruleus]|uniref:Uncharacterized protein n=1 Tax=Stentor coeruleus TaxID=5963 RepID=A0A1R2C025_9CILI|nr:hypothetical protein SteCoe_16958 [Stentor coeruleus]